MVQTLHLTKDNFPNVASAPAVTYEWSRHKFKLLSHEMSKLFAIQNEASYSVQHAGRLMEQQCTLTETNTIVQTSCTTKMKF